MSSRSNPSLLVLSALVAGALGGCADEQEPLIVLNAVSIDGGECFIDPQATPRLEGGLDLYFPGPYTLGVAVQNQLLSSPAETSNSGVDDGELQLRSADVELTSDRAPEIIDALEARDAALVDFSVQLATNSLPPGSTSGVGIPVISQAAALALAEEMAGLEPGTHLSINAHVTLHARRTGNAVGKVGDVAAREFVYPIEICIGCLLTCDSCEDGRCPPIEGVASGSGACGSLQDNPWAPAGCDDPSSN